MGQAWIFCNKIKLMKFFPRAAKKKISKNLFEFFSLTCGVPQNKIKELREFEFTLCPLKLC
jgi:hypothetical protein